MHSIILHSAIQVNKSSGRLVSRSSVLLDPLLNFPHDVEVLCARGAVNLLARLVSSPDHVAQVDRQGEPMRLTPPHSRWTLRLAPGPVAVMLPRLTLAANVVGLGHPLPLIAAAMKRPAIEPPRVPSSNILAMASRSSFFAWVMARENLPAFSSNHAEVSAARSSSTAFVMASVMHSSH